MKLKDKNGALMDYRTTSTGAILKKGKREVYLVFKKSVNKVNQSRKIISTNSFNALFTKGKKIPILGNNISYIKF